MKKLYVITLLYIVSVVCFLFVQRPQSAEAAMNMVFNNVLTDTVIEYDNTVVKYNYNGVDVDMNGNIGILGESGSALAPFIDLFVNTLAVDCEFSLSDSSLTFCDGSDTVSILPGSTTAIVNGVKTTVSEAPALMKNNFDELLYYVPTRFIASNLKFDYEWNKNLSTVFIEKTYSIKYTSDITGAAIEVPLLDSVDISDIRIDDMYYENKLAVYIPGNYVHAYENNVIINHYSFVTGIELALNAANETVLIFDLSKIMACKPEIQGDTLYLNFVQPRELYSKIVVIDPGHGGYDPGAIREKINESDLNLSIAYEYTKDLFAESDIKVYYTRTKDKFISLNERAQFAAQVGADFFVSLHQNTFTTSGKKGTSVYYSSDNKNVSDSGLSGKILAGILTERMSGRLELNNLGRLNQRLTVTTHNSVPAALVELAFMSNPDDLAKLKDAEFRKKAGQALFDIITEIFEEYPTGR